LKKIAENVEVKQIIVDSCIQMYTTITADSIQAYMRHYWLDSTCSDIRLDKGI